MWVPKAMRPKLSRVNRNKRLERSNPVEVVKSESVVRNSRRAGVRRTFAGVGVAAQYDLELPDFQLNRIRYESVEVGRGEELRADHQLSFVGDTSPARRKHGRTLLVAFR